MQLRLWASIVIFLGSYLPLSLILLVQDYKVGSFAKPICFDVLFDAACALPLMHPQISIPIFLLCSACALITLLILRLTRTKRKAEIISVKHIPSELMSYTLPYVVSFIGVGFDERSKFIGIVIFLGWMFWITHKSGQIVLNPLLVVFGWKLYEVKIRLMGEDAAQAQDKWALSKTDLAVADRVYATEMQDVWIIREQESSA